MADEKDTIVIRKPLPPGVFNPLFKKCFGDDSEFSETSSIESDKRLFDPMFPLYQNFSMVMREIGPITAKGVSYEENPSQLYSRSSLIPYKKMMDQRIKNIYVPFFSTHPALETIKKIVYSGAELEKLASEKIGDEELFSRIFDDAKANYYWTLLKISQGKRIGFYRTINATPDDAWAFYEFPDMQEFIPQYDKLKALSPEEVDFLRNASREEIGDRFVDMLSDFRSSYLEGREDDTLVRMIMQIQQYSERLEWDPTHFFRDLEESSKNPEIPTPAELLFR
jgi:hypothetical protein